MEQVLGYAFGLVIGLSMGLLGAGGSILTVPIFAYVMGFPPKEAIAGSLAIVGLSSAAGAVGHWRDGNLSVRTAFLFGGVAMAGAYIGARLATFIRGEFQLLLLAAVMLPAAVFMARPAKVEPSAGPVQAERTLLTVAVALAVGSLTGLAGVGGGFMIVPALVLLLGCSMRKAIGTSLAIIAANSVAGFAGYVGRVPIRWGFVAAFGAFAIVGTLVGTWLARRVDAAALRHAFAMLLVAVAMYIIYGSRSLFA
jgi:uncharacterized protein